MGNSQGTPSRSKKQDSSKEDDKAKQFFSRVKSNMEDEIYRKLMIQREVQMAVSIARARDTIQIFGTVWGIYTASIMVAQGIRKVKVPPAANIPVVVGALVLGNMADMAYGNKLQRVTKEAEYILNHESDRFVPVSQAPFEKFYVDKSRKEKSSAVGELFPSSLWARPSS